MKIVFAGTPEYASFHLELLLNSEHKIPFILTQPDKKSGRGNKIKVSPVKNLALKRGVEVKQPHTLKGNKKIISVLKEKNLDLILVVAYGLLIPREVLEIPKMGCINIHASLLPRWRGAAPIEHCILGGDISNLSIITALLFPLMDIGWGQCDSEVCLLIENVNVDENGIGTLDIYMTNSVSVGGGQFYIDGGLNIIV